MPTGKEAPSLPTGKEAPMIRALSTVKYITHCSSVQMGSPFLTSCLCVREGEPLEQAKISSVYICDCLGQDTAITW